MLIEKFRLKENFLCFLYYCVTKKARNSIFQQNVKYERERNYPSNTSLDSIFAIGKLYVL